MTQESIVVRTPGDLVAATPYVIGFHPTESLVVLGLAGNRIFFGARHDLPPPDSDDIVHLGAIVAAQRARSVALLAYGPPAAADPVVRQATQVFGAFRVRVAEAIRVHDGRWWSYYCGDPGCCPSDGTPFDAAGSVIAAEATYRGHVALPSRQALVAQVAPVEGAARRAMAAATERACERLQHLIVDDRPGERAVRRAGRLAVREAEKRYRAGHVLTDDEVAWLAVLLIDHDVHEYTLERPRGPQWRLALWTDALRRVEPAYVAAVGSVLGYLAWRAGNGPLARVAVDRALHADPRHSMAGLLDEVLGLGIGPHAMEALNPSARAATRRDRLSSGAGQLAAPSAAGGSGPSSEAGPSGQSSTAGPSGQPFAAGPSGQSSGAGPSGQSSGAGPSGQSSGAGPFEACSAEGRSGPFSAVGRSGSSSGAAGPPEAPASHGGRSQRRRFRSALRRRAREG